jgi:hypothetical protein
VYRGGNRAGDDVSELKFSKSTDSQEEIKLDSSLCYASWSHSAAYGGQASRFEVGTVFVGNRAKIKIEGKSKKGKKLGKISDVIRNNKYIGQFDIPEDIELGDEVYFEVKLAANGLDGESDHIPAYPPVKVSNLKWSAKEARRDDVLKLTADITGCRSGTEVMLTIYEYGADGAHDRITEFPAAVKDDRIEVMWEFEYHDPTVKIPTENTIQQYDKKRHYVQPEYFFTVTVGGEQYGHKQESGLLKFKDKFQFRPISDGGRPFPKEKYILHLADGTERKGTLDDKGEGIEEDLPPGEVTILLPDKGYLFGR